MWAYVTAALEPAGLDRADGLEGPVDAARRELIAHGPHHAASPPACQAGRTARRYDLPMCLICVEIAKSKMTVKEARQALREMREGMDRAHLAEVEQKLEQAERDGTAKP